MRGVAALLAALLAGTAGAQTITEARFDAPTTRYGHAILGDAVEWGALEMTLDTGAVQRIVLPEDHVFEDVAPRLLDVTGDGAPEVVVVETDIALGAALAIYSAMGKIAETPHIGRTHRWLAPIGAADLDGDGAVELAYIDRPHLAKTLRLWRYQNGGLTPIAELAGYTNHRIGEVDIAGGMRSCAGQPEMIVAMADWSRLAAIRFEQGRFHVADIGAHKNRRSFARAMACH